MTPGFKVGVCSVEADMPPCEPPIAEIRPASPLPRLADLWLCPIQFQPLAEPFRQKRAGVGNQTAANRHLEGIAMHYTFCIITSDGRGAMQIESLWPTTNREHAAKLKQCVQEQGRELRRKAQGRNVREVVVLTVDEKEHGRWCIQPGRNGLPSKPVQAGQGFRSATEASGHVGLRHNEVAMLLSRAAATGERRATVRGVTFAYKDHLDRNPISHRTRSAPM
jgi:hypothetical protein